MKFYGAEQQEILDNKNSVLLCVFLAYFAVDFYRSDHKEDTEITETKYYFECFLDLSLLI
ncbi:MAG: hypothetical protein JWR09_4350 [Mucilaginibacter sp.]|nr:hypothetical protein [Mucilaginibacter sp.]